MSLTVRPTLRDLKIMTVRYLDKILRASLSAYQTHSFAQRWEQRHLTIDCQMVTLSQCGRLFYRVWISAASNWIFVPNSMPAERQEEPVCCL